jgi:hypothetical protein
MQLPPTHKPLRLLHFISHSIIIHLPRKTYHFSVYFMCSNSENKIFFSEFIEKD